MGITVEKVFKVRDEVRLCLDVFEPCALFLLAFFPEFFGDFCDKK